MWREGIIKRVLWMFQSQTDQPLHKHKQLSLEKTKCFKNNPKPSRSLTKNEYISNWDLFSSFIIRRTFLKLLHLMAVRMTLQNFLEELQHDMKILYSRLQKAICLQLHLPQKKKVYEHSMNLDYLQIIILHESFQKCS